MEWVDSAQRSGWQDEKEMRRLAASDSLICWSVGYLLEETPRYILVCASQTAHGEGEEPGVGDVTQIPREAIRGLWALRR